MKPSSHLHCQTLHFTILSLSLSLSLSLFLSLSLSFLSALMSTFPDEPGLAGFTGAKDDGGGGDNWSYETFKAPVKSSPPTTNQHQVFL